MLRTTDANLAARLSQAGHTSEDAEGSRPVITTAALAPGEYAVQAITPSERVTRSNTGPAPLLTAAELAQARRGKVLLNRTIEGEPGRVLAISLGDGGVAIAGVSLDNNNSTLRQVTSGLVIGGAVFVIVAGLRS